VGSVLVALAVLASFSFPRLAERDVRASTRALDDRDFDTARDRARRARFFNPLSVDPVFALARVAELERKRGEARDRYVQAVQLQPDNPDTWFALGLYEFQVRADMCAAYIYFNNSYTLDPRGREWSAGGDLDQARDAVNKGACESH
jgi:hypothetical protein